MLAAGVWLLLASEAPSAPYDIAGVTTEKTEVLYGIENVIQRGLEELSNTKQRLDLCAASDAPSVIVVTKPMLNAYIEARKRGVKIRFITEITKENHSHCKEIMKFAEVRHLDKLKGHMGVTESQYGASAVSEEGKRITQLIHSNVKAFVQHQQYFFDMLWEKAIPAEQKIREIEEGREPERLELIEDTEKSISRAFDIMGKTKKELLVLFATPRTFTLAMSTGEPSEIYRKISERGGEVKLLIPRGGRNEVENNDYNEQIAKIREISPSSSVNVRISDMDLNTKITIMVSDRKEFMSWELKDDTLDDPYKAGGIATYSNMRSFTSSYGIIFDNLWKITDIAENLRIAIVKLDSNEKAMKEFINIAAHELRTPVQPLLGTAELFMNEFEGGKQKIEVSKDDVEMIIRNAKRLERLTSDILELSKIESNTLRLNKEIIDLNQKIRNVVNDQRSTIGKEKKLSIIFEQKKSIALLIRGDKLMLFRVLSNIVGNAIKFTDEGTITVTAEKNGDNKEVVVTIKDTGKGIDPEILPKLFTKFASKSDIGTGLGLYLSKGIIEAHDGKIWGENNKNGKGATFTFTLPLVT